MNPTAAIFDMDGTLADVNGIRHHVMQRRKRFDLFHDQSIDCPPNSVAIAAHAQALRDGHSILIVTARKAMWSMHTLLWLRDNNVTHDALFMRDNNDNRKDFDVKQDMLNRIRRTHTPVLAVDDNPSVIRLWQDNDIPTITIPGWVD